MKYIRCHFCCRSLGTWRHWDRVLSQKELYTYTVPYSLVFLEVVLFSKLRLFLVALRGEVPFPARAEVDVPTPELT